MVTKKAIDKTKNQVNILYPYRTQYGIWCFDDNDLDIISEPFVGNINTMIDMFAQGKTNIIAYISSEPIHNSTLLLIRRDDLGQGMYQLNGTDVCGWLCPCLLRYFPDYVEKIYAKIEIPKD